MQTKPWYKSSTIWFSLLSFYAGLSETFIDVWYPLLSQAEVTLDRQQVLTMSFKSVGLAIAVVGLVGTILGRARADTPLSFSSRKSDP